MWVFVILFKMEGGSGSQLFGCCFRWKVVVLVSCVGVGDSVFDVGW